MINEDVLLKLEYDKILKIISSYAVTERGKKLIEFLLPSNDQNYIILNGKLVEEAKNFIIKYGNVPIEFIPDISEDIFRSRIEGSVLNSKKILDILKLLINSRKFKSIILKEDGYQHLRTIASNLYSDKNLEAQISNALSDDGQLKDNASIELKRIRKEIIYKKEELTKSITKIIKRLKDDDYVREDYLTLRDGRMVIPVKVEHKRHIRGFIHSESATGQTVYIEPEETLELNNEIVSLFFAEQREVERILKELTKIIGEKSSHLISSFEKITELDTIFARAYYSIEILGCLPKINSYDNLHLIEARHPLLLKKLGRNNTVPLTFKLDNEKIIIITGPNAGGKTVVLKTIGLLSLMLQAGIHIPVHPDSNFLIFNKILVDIGDQQSIENDLSTFSSHLKNIKFILEQADEKTLVLLDEIGTGTDPTEGAALAKAILKKLLLKSTLTFATTHLGELKIFAFEMDKINNASMQFDNATLSPTYKFNLGFPGSSYAFEITEKSGIPKDVISIANAYLDVDKQKLEKFISEVEKKSFQLEMKLKQVELENLRLKSLSDLYKKSYDKLEKEKKEIIKKTKIEAERLVKELNKKFENIVKEVKESNADKNVIKKGKELLREIQQEVQNHSENNKVPESLCNVFNLGDYVSINNSTSFGKIIEINKKKKKVTLLAGNVKLSVNLDNIQPAKKLEQSIESSSYDYMKTSTTNYRLDIRGKRIYEAEFEIIKFIDDAYQYGYQRVEILHGKGTGALKKLVNEILSANKYIKKYYYAPIEIGGDGITIVEF